MELFYALDRAGLMALNQFIGAAPAFDKLMLNVASNDLLKGGLIIGMLWWCWITPSIRIHFFAVRAVTGAVLAVAVGRAMQNLLPPRLRPLHQPELDVLLPAGMNPDTLAGWGSFPSDNAVLFFALSTAIWMRSRSLGLFAFAWSLVVVCLPRIYFGYHYPSDIVGGAAIGIALMLLAMRLPTLERLRQPFESAQIAWPKLMFAATFLITFEMASLFEGLRRLLSDLKLLSAAI